MNVEACKIPAVMAFSSKCIINKPPLSFQMTFNWIRNSSKIRVFMDHFYSDLTLFHFYSDEKINSSHWSNNLDSVLAQPKPTSSNQTQCVMTNPVTHWSNNLDSAVTQPTPTRPNPPPNPVLVSVVMQVSYLFM